jgi:uncharacterized protein (DUF1697 family)
VTRQAALLRGVNVGGRQVAMAELRAIVEAAGYANVATLLASGNLVLEAKQKGAKLEAALETVILEGLGLKADVYVRDANQLDAIIAGNPFKAFTTSQPGFMVVNFMRAPASAAELEAMKKTALTGEDWRPGANCLSIKFKLKTPKLGTARNWNTVLKLAAAAHGA